jgi:heme/copper-type cytochrome/quinol oxidase subunit 3
MSPHSTAGAEVQLAIAIVKTLILLTGGAVTFFAYKAYARTEQRSLGLLAAGFGLITLGVLLAGFLSELFGQTLAFGILIESLLVLAGLLVIAYSLYEP